MLGPAVQMCQPRLSLREIERLAIVDALCFHQALLAPMSKELKISVRSLRERIKRDELLRHLAAFLREQRPSRSASVETPLPRD